MAPEEEQAFARQISREPGLALLVKEIADGFGNMAAHIPQVEPPASLRDEILNAVAALDRPQKSVPSYRVHSPIVQGTVKNRSTPWLITLAAASLALGLLIASLFLQNRDLKLQIAQSVGNQEQLSNEIEKLNDALRVSKTEASLNNLRLAALRSELNLAYEVLIAWDQTRQSGILSTGTLPTNSPEQDYQLWIVDRDVPSPVSGGVFHVTSNQTVQVTFNPTHNIKNPVAFALSLERKGGVPTREGPIVVQHGL